MKNVTERLLYIVEEKQEEKQARYVYYPTCMYMYECMYMYVCYYVHVHVHVCMYVCMHVCMYACMYVHVYIYVCNYVHTKCHNYMYIYVRIQIPESIPTFDIQSNNLWDKRHRALKRFIQAARKVIIQNRCQQRLEKLNKILQEVKSGKEIGEYSILETVKLIKLT